MSTVLVSTSTAKVWEPVSVLSTTPARQLYSLVDEDDVSPDDGGLMPRKRRVVAAGGEGSAAVDVGGSGFVLQETSTIHIGEIPEASL